MLAGATGVRLKSKAPLSLASEERRVSRARSRQRIRSIRRSSRGVIPFGYESMTLSVGISKHNMHQGLSRCLLPEASAPRLQAGLMEYWHVFFF
jgi:hypothetical protein